MGDLMVTEEPVRWAIIKDGVVVNVCLWNGDTARWQPPEGCGAMMCPDEVAIGWTFEGEDFFPPEPVVEDPPPE